MVKLVLAILLLILAWSVIYAEVPAAKNMLSASYDVVGGDAAEQQQEGAGEEKQTGPYEVINEQFTRAPVKIARGMGNTTKQLWRTETSHVGNNELNDGVDAPVTKNKKEQYATGPCRSNY